MSARPVPLAPNFGSIPPILTAQPCWVLWSYVLKDGKYTKVPKRPGGSYASTTNPATWSTFAGVRSAYERGGFDGVGIVLTGKPLENGLFLIGLDFDHCLTAGVLDEDPRQAVKRLDTYAEISPSGEGNGTDHGTHEHAIATTTRPAVVDGRTRNAFDREVQGSPSCAARW